MMKKLNFLAIVLCVCPAVLFGQLKVQQDGKTVVYSSATAPVGSAQFSVITSDIEKGLLVQNTQTSDVETIGLYSAAFGANANTHNLIGVHGCAAKGEHGQGVSIGVLGTTGWTLDGKSYGVYGAISPGIFKGAGVFGYAPYSSDNSFAYPNLTSRHAGYFRGAVTITDLLNAPVATWNSDYRYKQNIKELSQRETVDNLLKLNPVEYNFKQRQVEASDSLGNTVEVGYFDEQSPIFRKKHYGLIAQEVKELYPDLVYEDGDGYLSIDYVGIIPLLIQSVKELKSEIEDLKGNDFLSKAKATETSEQSAALYQNTPNPFSQSTEIKYYLPTSVTTASLCIYDLNGKQLKQIRLTTRGAGSQTISGSEFSAGIYLYALIADGKEIDVKRMILTE